MKIFIKREWFILISYLKLLFRNFNKYFKVSSTAYFAGTFGIVSAAKPAYFFCRYIDDIADGDHLLPEKEFRSLLEKLKAIITNNTCAKTGLEATLKKALDSLHKNNQPKIVDDEFISFLDAMLHDYERRIHRKACSKEELLNIYDQSFKPVLHLAFLGLGVQIDEKYIYELGRLQGRIYAIQDLEEELKKGIINLPTELLNEINLSTEKLCNTPRTLQKTDRFKNWIQTECKECLSYITDLRALKIDHEKSKK